MHGRIAQFGSAGQVGLSSGYDNGERRLRGREERGLPLAIGPAAELHAGQRRREHTRRARPGVLHEPVGVVDERLALQRGAEPAALGVVGIARGAALRVADQVQRAVALGV
jgi:hypothetical protein